MWVNKNKLFLSLLFAVVLFGQASYAQTISTLRPLSFRTIAIKNYTSMISMTVNASGGYSTNSNTYIVEAPQRGEYLITGAPVSTSYTVTIPASIIMTGPGGGFTVDNFTTFPNTLTTNGAGEATFYIGARATTAGGMGYGDGTYGDSFDITVNY